MHKHNILSLVLIVALIASSALSVVFHRQAKQAEVLATAAQRSLERVERQPDSLSVKLKRDQNAPDSPSSEALNKARDRIRELEQQIQSQEAQLASLQQAATNAVVVTVDEESSEPEERRSWMERLREDDPERYQEILVRREAARSAAKYEAAKRASYFLNRDLSGLNEEEAEGYQMMVNLLAETMDLTDQLSTELPGDQRWGIMRKMRENIRELSPMMEEARDLELFQMGKDMGYTDEDAEAFSLYVKDVIDLTSVHSIFRSSMRAMGGGGFRRDGGNDSR